MEEKACRVGPKQCRIHFAASTRKFAFGDVPAQLALQDVITATLDFSHFHGFNRLFSIEPAV